MTLSKRIVRPLIAAALTLAGVAHANAYRETGKRAVIGSSTLTVTPPRDWNRLSHKPGKNVETWTLDGEQLNEVNFYAGIEPETPLLRERNRKRAPLPRFRANTLLVEVPELLNGTYRTLRGVASFRVTSSTAGRFVGASGIRFAYEYLDDDGLPRRGEGRAALVGGRLYMATFDAPRLHYFDKTVGDFRRLVDSATLS